MHSIMLLTRNGEALYVQIYNHLKMEIERGDIVQGEKLPSIRMLAKMLNVSKITVEMAYQQLLSEGYILNANRSRYTVAAVEMPHAVDASMPAHTAHQPPKPKVRYDFSSGEMDPDGFDFSLWRRYLGRVVGQDQARLMRYGHTQGEAELREQIAKYIRQSRGVAAQPSQVIIGPGVQSLLGTVCSLLRQEHTHIAFEDPGFKNGRSVFADHGYEVLPIGMKPGGMDMVALEQSGARLVYVSPSHQFPTGSIMPVGKRNRLLAWAEQQQGLIIEDDYDSEFRYFGRPIPALKGLDRTDRVVYLGSFSKIMPPSMRISYLVLPPTLMERFHQKAALYNQGASTVEQLALSAFMQDGHLEKQIRRLRKRYQEKRQLFLQAIEREMDDIAQIQQGESGLFTILRFRTPQNIDLLAQRALQQGCRVAFMRDYALRSGGEELQRQAILYFSSIPLEQVEQAVACLAAAWR